MSLLEMVNLPIVFMILIATLVCALTIIITQLYKNFVTPEYCLELIMRFSHDEFTTLKREANGSKETISLSLIGAVEYFGKKHMLPKKQRQIIAIKILKSHLDLSAKELSRYYSRAASYKAHDKQILTLIKGAKAARQWLSFQSDKRKLSASRHMQSFAS